MSNNGAMETSEKYDAIYKEKPDKWTDTARDDFAFKCVSDYLQEEPSTLLDLGCGNGHTLSFFHAFWPDVRYFGIDMSIMAVKLARAAVPVAKIYHATPDNFESQETFDVILVMGVAEHFHDLGEQLDIVRKWLSEDGIVYLEVPNNLVISGREEEGWFASSMQTEWHLKRENWEKMLLSVGFKIERSIVGDSEYNEFIWILKNVEWIPG
jgi:trans-aconitate methyltransferase